MQMFCLNEIPSFQLIQRSTHTLPTASACLQALPVGQNIEVASNTETERPEMHEGSATKPGVPHKPAVQRAVQFGGLGGLQAWPGQTQARRSSANGGAGGEDCGAGAVPGSRVSAVSTSGVPIESNDEGGAVNRQVRRSKTARTSSSGQTFDGAPAPPANMGANMFARAVKAVKASHLPGAQQGTQQGPAPGHPFSNAAEHLPQLPHTLSHNSQGWSAEGSVTSDSANGTYAPIPSPTGHIRYPHSSTRPTGYGLTPWDPASAVVSPSTHLGRLVFCCVSD